MTIIPFHPNIPDKDETTKSSLLATYYTLEEQLELLNAQIQAKEENLQTLSHWGNSETFRQYQKETDLLRRERVLLEKTQQIVMNELMKKKD